MTTIAYRDGVMASDSRAWSGGHSPIGDKQKIRRLVDGTLIGCSTSTPGGSEQVLDWFEAGASREAKDLPKEFDLLVVTAAGEAFLAADNPLVSGPLQAPYFAIGSGRQYALGALCQGADALRAISVAIQLDTVSGGPIRTIKHTETE